LATRLTAREYAIASPDIALAMGLDAREYGVLMCEREDGHRVTLLGDADHTRMLINASPRVRAGLEIPSERYPIELDGWPADWGLGEAEIGGEG
jgi:hypothetical protein